MQSIISSRYSSVHEQWCHHHPLLYSTLLYPLILSALIQKEKREMVHERHPPSAHSKKKNS
jgi:hypothetical protein